MAFPRNNCDLLNDNNLALSCNFVLQVVNESIAKKIEEEKNFNNSCSNEVNSASFIWNFLQGKMSQRREIPISVRY